MTNYQPWVDRHTIIVTLLIAATLLLHLQGAA